MGVAVTLADAATNVPSSWSRRRRRWNRKKEDLGRSSGCCWCVGRVLFFLTRPAARWTLLFPSCPSANQAEKRWRRREGGVEDGPCSCFSSRVRVTSPENRKKKAQVAASFFFPRFSYPLSALFQWRQKWSSFDTSHYGSERVEPRPNALLATVVRTVRLSDSLTPCPSCPPR